MTIHRRLFSPVTIGPITLRHLVVMAPLTRSRSRQPGDIPRELMLQYYSQRASEGGFIISEATAISITGRGWFGAPGMYSDEQVSGWRRITDAVHAKGGRMFSQLWHVGRSSNVEMTGGATPIAPSVVHLIGWIPRLAFRRPVAGSGLRRIGRSTSEKSRTSSRTIEKPLSAPNPRGLTGSSFMPGTVTSPTTSCRTV